MNGLPWRSLGAHGWQPAGDSSLNWSSLSAVITGRTTQGASRAGWDWGQAPPSLATAAHLEILTASPRGVPHHPDLKPKRTPSHIPGFHAHLIRGTHLPLDTLRWMHTCFTCKSNKRNMACGDGRHYSDTDKTGCMQKQGQVWLGAKAESPKSTLSRLPSTGAGVDVLETRKTWSLEISWACDLIK